MTEPWRTGRKLGRTIFAQLGPEPSDDDPLIGLMDTRELAERVVKDHNREIADAIGADVECQHGNWTRNGPNSRCADCGVAWRDLSNEQRERINAVEGA